MTRYRLVDAEQQNDQPTVSSRESEGSFHYNAEHISAETRLPARMTWTACKAELLADGPGETWRSVWKSFVPATASLTSLYTAISIWTVALGTDPHCSRTNRQLPLEDKMASGTFTLPGTFSTPQEPSIEVSIIVIHVYVLATTTLHRSRKQDRYQNAMGVFCILGAACSCLHNLPGRTWQEILIFMMASLPALIAFGFSLSAVAHASFGCWESHRAIGLQVGKTGEPKEKDCGTPLSYAAREGGRTLAVEATPRDHPDRAGWLNELGNILGRRFERTVSMDDLNRAVGGTPHDHTDRAGSLSNLEISLSH